MSALSAGDVPCDIILYFLAKMPIFNVLAFACISSIAFDLARHELRGRHRRVLNRFVGDPGGLLNILEVCEAIISGSFALNYAYGEGSWLAHDLDIYVNPFMFRALVAYLVEQEGFQPYIKPDFLRRKLTAIERRGQ